MEGSPSNKHGFETLVTLQPFIHQVGGHSTIQQFDQYTVCKPLFSKELRFYEEVCPAFKPFIPEFKGVVSVKDLKEHQDSVCQVVRSSDDIKLHIYRYGKHCNTCSCQRTKDISKNQKHENEIWSSDEESKSSSGLNYGYCNLDDSSLEYILLENVVGHYKYPCILDLKMGTEKHKDYIISKEEAERRQARWDQTTSRSLGVRVCGMKVYLVDKCEFFVMSTGRNLTIDGFKDAIKKFLYNGKRYRLDVIEPYLNQLGELLNIMENQSFYRFYNTSLLLIYEGDDSSETDHNFFKADTAGQRRNNDGESHGTILNESKISNVNVGVRMIDFAHVDYNNQTNSSALQPVPDENYLVGLRSVIRILKDTLVELRTNKTLTDS